MTQYQIKSNSHVATFSEMGAELCSLKEIESGEEFIWNAENTIWNRHSPILFPIVGRLNQDKYQYNGNSFGMTQHGFARDLNFEVVEIYTDFMRFMLQSDANTLKKYPFQFKLFIEYKITDNRLTTKYTVHNPGVENLYFSIGAHPGFILPNPKLEEFYIEFNQIEENLKSHLIESGLLTGKTEKILINQGQQLDLDSSSFSKDAIVFKHLKSDKISLKHRKTNWEIQMQFENFPFFGIWTKYPHQKFLCLEPWAGIADSSSFLGGFNEKEGICCAEPGSQLEFSYHTTFKSTI